MSDPLDAQQILDHCMRSIKGASEAMPSDMHDAAMKLGVAAMMLASASHAVHKHAALVSSPPTHPDAADA